MSKPLFTLCLAFAGEKTPFHFENYEALLGARVALVGMAIPGLTFEEDPATRHLFLEPEAAASHARLWAESLGGHAAPAKEQAKPNASEEDVLPNGLTHKEEVLHMLLRPSGVTLDQIVERYNILRDSASAIISTTCSKFGYTAHRSEAGVYTATKGRADGRGMPKAPAKARTEPTVHVLGRRRRVEHRAH